MRAAPWAGPRARRALGTLLVWAGLALLLSTAGLYAYGELGRRQFEAELARRELADAATATAVAQPVAELPAPTSSTAATPAVPTPAVAVAVEPTAAASPARPSPAPATPTATARPTATPVAIRRVVARSIGLDAPVVEAKVVGGEWQVPKFAAGHLEGTASPGHGSNVVLSGHLQSLSSGNVFAELDRLELGDEVVLRTTGGEAAYRVTGRNLVAPTDLSVVAPTPHEELTLITCAGTFNPLTGDYTQRLVVWGERVG